MSHPEPLFQIRILPDEKVPVPTGSRSKTSRKASMGCNKNIYLLIKP
jgi:hypothetical protein